jgi:YidC/Oxa1 family membrane protein insertase
MVVARHPQRPEWSDVSIVMTSEPVTLPGGGTARHDFALYFGPKRSELLRVLGAEPVKDFGWFGVISRGMLAILNFFHHTLYVPYGLAIVLLTVVVRGCLFPVSRKMAENQNRMKELQPKMQEIREKYKDDQEKMAEAYREFMAKHGFNPLAGCLPMFLQLPIFIGLYQALYHAVDLRLARFLWIDNLAAPDELFPLGFTVPFVGWTDFNLLPLITIGLFLVQQKMFMPPPTSEEQALQYKMMNYFTLFLGFMFYRVPAGLCVYFIASSLWGLAERKLLTLFERPKSATEDGTGPSPGGRGDEPPRGGGPAGEAGPKPPGLLQRLREAADQAKQQAGGAPVPRDDRRKDRRPGRRKSRHGR